MKTTLAGLDAFLARYDAFNRIPGPGLALMVVKDRKILLQRCWGLADLETKEPVSALSNFDLASCGKQFTGMAVAMLEEEGRLDPERPVTDHFPDLPSCFQSVKVRHLVHQCSGAPEYLAIKECAGIRIVSHDVVEILKTRDELDFAPGARYQYSNTNYVLLALIVEKTSGIPFSGFVRKRIFKPLGMDGSVLFDQESHEVPRRVRGYGPWPLFERADVGYGEFFVYGDGGVWASLEDLYKWTRGLEMNRLVSRGTMDRILSGNYGYGWFVGHFKGHRKISHTGSWTGFTSIISWYPDQGLWIVALLNGSSPLIRGLDAGIAAFFVPGAKSLSGNAGSGAAREIVAAMRPQDPRPAGLRVWPVS